jgi:hypothetical protein
MAFVGTGGSFSTEAIQRELNELDRLPWTLLRAAHSLGYRFPDVEKAVSGSGNATPSDATLVGLLPSLGGGPLFSSALQSALTPHSTALLVDALKAMEVVPIVTLSDLLQAFAVSGSGSFASGQEGKGRPQGSSKKCRICGDTGHLQANCPQSSKKSKKGEEPRTPVVLQRPSGTSTTAAPVATPSQEYGESDSSPVLSSSTFNFTIGEWTKLAVGFSRLKEIARSIESPGVAYAILRPLRTRCERALAVFQHIFARCSSGTTLAAMRRLVDETERTGELKKLRELRNSDETRDPAILYYLSHCIRCLTEFLSKLQYLASMASAQQSMARFQGAREFRPVSVGAPAAVVPSSLTPSGVLGAPPAYPTELLAAPTLAQLLQALVQQLLLQAQNFLSVENQRLTMKLSSATEFNRGQSKNQETSDTARLGQLGQDALTVLAKTTDALRTMLTTTTIKSLGQLLGASQFFLSILYPTLTTLCEVSKILRYSAALEPSGVENPEGRQLVSAGPLKRTLLILAMTDFVALAIVSLQYLRDEANRILFSADGSGAETAEAEVLKALVIPIKVVAPDQGATGNILDLLLVAIGFGSFEPYVRFEAHSTGAESDALRTDCRKLWTSSLKLLEVISTLEESVQKGQRKPSASDGASPLLGSLLRPVRGTPLESTATHQALTLALRRLLSTPALFTDQYHADLSEHFATIGWTAATPSDPSASDRREVSSKKSGGAFPLAKDQLFTHLWIPMLQKLLHKHYSDFADLMELATRDTSLVASPAAVLSELTDILSEETRMESTQQAVPRSGAAVPSRKSLRGLVDRLSLLLSVILFPAATGAPAHSIGQDSLPPLIASALGFISNGLAESDSTPTEWTPWVDPQLVSCILSLLSSNVEAMTEGRGISVSNPSQQLFLSRTVQLLVQMLHLTTTSRSVATSSHRTSIDLVPQIIRALATCCSASTAYAPPLLSWTDILNVLEVQAQAGGPAATSNTSLVHILRIIRYRLELNAVNSAPLSTRVEINGRRRACSWMLHLFDVRPFDREVVSLLISHSRDSANGTAATATASKSSLVSHELLAIFSNSNSLKQILEAIEPDVDHESDVMRSMAPSADSLHTVVLDAPGERLSLEVFRTLFRFMASGALSFDESVQAEKAWQLQARRYHQTSAPDVSGETSNRLGRSQIAEYQILGEVTRAIAHNLDSQSILLHIPYFGNHTQHVEALNGITKALAVCSLHSADVWAKSRASWETAQSTRRSVAAKDPLVTKAFRLGPLAAANGTLTFLLYVGELERQVATIADSGAPTTTLIGTAVSMRKDALQKYQQYFSASRFHFHSIAFSLLMSELSLRDILLRHPGTFSSIEAAACAVRHGTLRLGDIRNFAQKMAATVGVPESGRLRAWFDAEKIAISLILATLHLLRDADFKNLPGAGSIEAVDSDLLQATSLLSTGSLNGIHQVVTTIFKLCFTVADDSSVGSPGSPASPATVPTPKSGPSTPVKPAASEASGVPTSSPQLRDRQVLEKTWATILTVIQHLFERRFAAAQTALGTYLEKDLCASNTADELSLALMQPFTLTILVELTRIVFSVNRDVDLLRKLHHALQSNLTRIEDSGTQSARLKYLSEVAESGTTIRLAKDEVFPILTQYLFGEEVADDTESGSKPPKSSLAMTLVNPISVNLRVTLAQAAPGTIFDFAAEEAWQIPVHHSRKSEEYLKSQSEALREMSSWGRPNPVPSSNRSDNFRSGGHSASHTNYGSSTAASTNIAVPSFTMITLLQAPLRSLLRGSSLDALLLSLRSENGIRSEKGHVIAMETVVEQLKLQYLSSFLYDQQHSTANFQSPGQQRSNIPLLLNAFGSSDRLGTQPRNKFHSTLRALWTGNTSTARLAQLSSTFSPLQRSLITAISLPWPSVEVIHHVLERCVAECEGKDQKEGVLELEFALTALLVEAEAKNHELLPAAAALTRDPAFANLAKSGAQRSTEDVTLGLLAHIQSLSASHSDTQIAAESRVEQVLRELHYEVLSSSQLQSTFDLNPILARMGILNSLTKSTFCPAAGSELMFDGEGKRSSRFRQMEAWSLELLRRLGKHEHCSAKLRSKLLLLGIAALEEALKASTTVSDALAQVFPSSMLSIFLGHSKSVGDPSQAAAVRARAVEALLGAPTAVLKVASPLVLRAVVQLRSAAQATEPASPTEGSKAGHAKKKTAFLTEVYRILAQELQPFLEAVSRRIPSPELSLLAPFLSNDPEQNPEAPNDEQVTEGISVPAPRSRKAVSTPPSPSPPTVSTIIPTAWEPSVKTGKELMNQLNKLSCFPSEALARECYRTSAAVTRAINCFPALERGSPGQSRNNSTEETTIQGSRKLSRRRGRRSRKEEDVDLYNRRVTASLSGVKANPADSLRKVQLMWMGDHHPALVEKISERLSAVAELVLQHQRDSSSPNETILSEQSPLWTDFCDQVADQLHFTVSFCRTQRVNTQGWVEPNQVLDLLKDVQRVIERLESKVVEFEQTSGRRFLHFIAPGTHRATFTRGGFVGQLSTTMPTLHKLLQGIALFPSGLSHPQGGSSISSVRNLFAVLNTKTRPRMLFAVLADGTQRELLLKGNEHLNVDANVLKLLSFLNSAARDISRKNGFQQRLYQVLPFPAGGGIVEIVPNVQSIFSLHVSHYLHFGLRDVMRCSHGAAALERYVLDAASAEAQGAKKVKGAATRGDAYDRDDDDSCSDDENASDDGSDDAGADVAVNKVLHEVEGTVRKVSTNEMFFKKLRAISEDPEIHHKPRTSWAKGKVAQTIRELTKEAPRDLLARELVTLRSLLATAVESSGADRDSRVVVIPLQPGTSHPSQLPLPAALVLPRYPTAADGVTARGWYRRLLQLQQSLGQSSATGHIVGLGDRHLDNIMIDFTTGDIVQIDLGVAFDRGRSLRVPETVPFRLTPVLTTALGTESAGGVFSSAMTNVLVTAQRYRRDILTLVEAQGYVESIEGRTANAAAGKTDAALNIRTSQSQQAAATALGATLSVIDADLLPAVTKFRAALNRFETDVKLADINLWLRKQRSSQQQVWNDQVIVQEALQRIESLKQETEVVASIQANLDSKMRTHFDKLVSLREVILHQIGKQKRLLLDIADNDSPVWKLVNTTSTDYVSPLKRILQEIQKSIAFIRFLDRVDGTEALLTGDDTDTTSKVLNCYMTASHPTRRLLSIVDRVLAYPFHIDTLQTVRGELSHFNSGARNTIESDQVLVAVQHAARRLRLQLQNRIRDDQSLLLQIRQELGSRTEMVQEGNSSPKSASETEDFVDPAVKMQRTSEKLSDTIKRLAKSQALQVLLPALINGSGASALKGALSQLFLVQYLSSVQLVGIPSQHFEAGTPSASNNGWIQISQWCELHQLLSISEQSQFMFNQDSSPFLQCGGASNGSPAVDGLMTHFHNLSARAAGLWSIFNRVCQVTDETPQQLEADLKPLVQEALALQLEWSSALSTGTPESAEEAQGRWLTQCLQSNWSGVSNTLVFLHQLFRGTVAAQIQHSKDTLFPFISTTFGLETTSETVREDLASLESALQALVHSLVPAKLESEAAKGAVVTDEWALLITTQLEAVSAEFKIILHSLRQRCDLVCKSSPWLAGEDHLSVSVSTRMDLLQGANWLLDSQSPAAHRHLRDATPSRKAGGTSLEAELDQLQLLPNDMLSEMDGPSMPTEPTEETAFEDPFVAVEFTASLAPGTRRNLLEALLALQNKATDETVLGLVNEVIALEELRDPVGHEMHLSLDDAPSRVTIPALVERDDDDDEDGELYQQQVETSPSIPASGGYSGKPLLAPKNPFAVLLGTCREAVFEVEEFTTSEVDPFKRRLEVSQLELAAATCTRDEASSRLANQQSVNLVATAHVNALTSHLERNAAQGVDEVWPSLFAALRRSRDHLMQLLRAQQPQPGQRQPSGPGADTAPLIATLPKPLAAEVLRVESTLVALGEILATIRLEPQTCISPSSSPITNESTGSTPNAASSYHCWRTLAHDLQQAAQLQEEFVASCLSLWENAKTHGYQPPTDLPNLIPAVPDSPTWSETVGQKQPQAGKGKPGFGQRGATSSGGSAASQKGKSDCEIGVTLAPEAQRVLLSVSQKIPKPRSSALGLDSDPSPQGQQGKLGQEVPNFFTQVAASDQMAEQSIARRTRSLIDQAMDFNNLCAMYEGWGAWL